MGGEREKGAVQSWSPEDLAAELASILLIDSIVLLPLPCATLAFAFAVEEVEVEVCLPCVLFS